MVRGRGFPQKGHFPFIAEVLRIGETFFKQVQAELEKEDPVISELTKKIQEAPTFSLCNEREKERARLVEETGADCYAKERAARFLAKRFETLVEGGKLYSAKTTNYYLRGKAKPK